MLIFFDSFQCIFINTGLSKHIRMAVISYSAEGVSFKDREKYPYFFRTIGENRQYENVYVQLLKELNWHRVVAFTGLFIFHFTSHKPFFSYLTLTYLGEKKCVGFIFK